jgi:hypothetical protein
MFSYCYCTIAPTNEPDSEVDTLGEIRMAVEHPMTHFRQPLAAKSVSLIGIQDELEEAVTYARKHLTIECDNYQ